MEAGLTEIVRSLNRSWIYDTYFSLYRAIHPGEKSGRNVRGEMTEYPLNINTPSCTISATEYGLSLIGLPMSGSQWRDCLDLHDPHISLISDHQLAAYLESTSYYTAFNVSLMQRRTSSRATGEEVSYVLKRGGVGNRYFCRRSLWTTPYLKNFGTTKRISA